MLLFEVTGQTLKRTDRFDPATDSQEYLKAKFTINDPDWSGKTKTALFRLCDKTYKAVLNTSGVCSVPNEVLVGTVGRYAQINGSTVCVSLIGEYGKTRITTNEIPVKFNASGYADADTPANPTESEYQQMTAVAADAVAEAEAARTECEAARSDLVGVKNIFANAIKGNVSGAVVAVGDVSPVEHNPVVLVHGKNLFDTSKISIQASTNNIYVSAVGEGYIEITDTESYDGNGHVSVHVKLKELCPQMRAGKQYVISATSEGWNKCIYLAQLDLFWQFGSVLTVTEEMLECSTGFYGFAPYRGQEHGTCRISNIQCEEGGAATEYTPYIDPSTVTVSRFGKNLVNVSSDEFVQYKRVLFDHPLPAGRYTMSANIKTNDTDDNQMLVAFMLSNGSTLSRTFIADNNRKVNDFTVDLPITGINFYASSTYNGGEGDTARWIDFQLEVGDKASAFEPYNGETYTPAADGTVDGLTSISPNMTILTDTDGAVVECEYIRDSNKVIESLVNAITALGGTV